MLLVAVMFAVLLPAASEPRAVQVSSAPPTATLKVAGDVARPLTLTIADLEAMPRTKVEIRQNTSTTVFEGVLVGDILKRAGALTGGDTHGNELATYIVATATDGYKIVFSLGELDPRLTHNDIIVADTADGKPLPPTQGPLRLVTPKDERGPRGVHMLQQLTVVKLK